MNSDTPMIGHKYKHFKGDTVEVTAIAKHSETLELLIVYTHAGQTWARPYSEWRKEIKDQPDVKRFEIQYGMGGMTQVFHPDD